MDGNVTMQLKSLLLSKGQIDNDFDTSILEKLASDPEIIQSISAINWAEETIMAKHILFSRINDFKDLGFYIPNGKANEAYTYTFPAGFFQEYKIVSHQIEGLEDFNLSYDIETGCISGKPDKSGNFSFDLLFKVEDETEADDWHTKKLTFVINPDPKSLWKNLPSDQEAKFWKKDDVSFSQQIGERKVLVSSKRGRSHQNVGSFRDDDFAFKYFDTHGWSILTVSDGAGSAPYSRTGSEVVCQEVINYFDDIFKQEDLSAIEAQIIACGKTGDINSAEYKAANSASIQAFYQSVLHAFNKIGDLAKTTHAESSEEFDAKRIKQPIDAFHSTLIATAFKKFEFGFVIVSFGVGDCPIGIVNKDGSNAQLLNVLDVGEFGGGTRFITQQEIYSSEERPLVSRFNFKIVDDFSYLFMMTDGIYDPKFEVEANLEKTDKWLEFIADLKGKNDDEIAIDFDGDLSDAENQLNQWMDFWSVGNHDDRTLAIVF